ncbi:hypothetical protein Sjap_004567 [Stephania japonica]|uniref:Uncharacterized protein n=1 Tax=Stephania japonica TaxID=461633 RepID=A0AAP0K3R3_9MAGN
MDVDGNSSSLVLSETAYELLYEIVKESHQKYLANGTLMALDRLSAFDIQKEMKGWVEWHMITFNQIRALEELNKIKKHLHISSVLAPEGSSDRHEACLNKELTEGNNSILSESPYEILYGIVKQGHQKFLNNGTLMALDKLSAFDIKKEMGGWVEWHMITFNQIRVLEEVDKIKKRLHIESIMEEGSNDHPKTHLEIKHVGEAPYEILFEIVKQGHQRYLNNGTLMAFERLSAFDIQKEMGGWVEWHMITFNQIRILEELNKIKKSLHIANIADEGSNGLLDMESTKGNNSVLSETPYEILYEIVKQGHQKYLNNGTLMALDRLSAFDIQKEMRGWVEWHMITFNQIRILEELNKIEKHLHSCKEE